MKTPQPIQLIMTTYPGFHELPKGVKKMLLVSESFFFDDMTPHTEHLVAPVSVNLPSDFTAPETMTVPARAA